MQIQDDVRRAIRAVEPEAVQDVALAVLGTALRTAVEQAHFDGRRDGWEEAAAFLVSRAMWAGPSAYAGHLREIATQLRAQRDTLREVER